MLNKFILEQLIVFFQKNPVAQGKPTTDDEVLIIEKALNIKLDDDFKEFTMRFGGCVVRDAQIYGIHNSEFLGEDTIIDLNKEFSDYLKDGQSNLIIGTDGWGNPIYISPSKTVMIYNHDTDELLTLAANFSDYLEKILKKQIQQTV